MRVYLPATLPLVAGLVAAGSWAAPVDGYAVTDLLRAWADQSGPSDDEELELVALSEAARGSLRLLAAAAPGASARRVVLAVDVPDVPDGLVRVDDGPDTRTPGQVVVTVDVPLAWVRAALVDDEAAAAVVRAAAGSVAAADAATDDGGGTAESVVAAADAHDLLWYAAEEIESVLG